MAAIDKLYVKDYYDHYELRLWAMNKEEKEKAYDKALEQAKKELAACGSMDCDAARQIFRFFPQLRESEDERIRKALIDALKVSETIGELKFRLPYPTREEYIAYLEKQKESLHIQETCKENTDSFTSEDEKIRKEIIDFLETIPISELKRIPRPICQWFFWLEKQKEPHIPWYDYQKSKEAGYTIVPNEEYEQLIKQKEQKPAWSEEDTDMLNCCISSIEEAKENRYAYKETDGDTSYDREIDWLKSLRPSWKPSEEQMAWLKLAIDEAKEPLKSQLEELYKDIRENLIWK